jgi:phage-related tail protein
MSMEKLQKEIEKTNKLITELIIVTKQTRKTLTMVNIINTITLIVIGYLAVRGIL